MPAFLGKASHGKRRHQKCKKKQLGSFHTCKE
jgi:hypothetical protein